MTKILKEGKKELFEVICSNCGCEFTAETNDFKVQRVFNYHGYNNGNIDQIRYITCPYCGKQINDNIKKI